jgi:hypothetical protein
MVKIRLWLVLIGLVLWPVVALAQSSNSCTLISQAKLSDLELSETRGQGIDKPQSSQEINAGRIILWDECKKANHNGLSVSGSGVNLILTSPRP